jgi:hypothetical protein
VAAVKSWSGEKGDNAMIRVVGVSSCLLAVVVVQTGCGPSGPRMNRVTGTVSYQNEPLPYGIIMFVPESGPPSQPVRIGPDGRYELKAVAGRHAVQVVAVPPVEGELDPNEEGGINYSQTPPPKSLIPEKYNRHETSGVSVLVEQHDDNVLDIELK